MKYIDFFEYELFVCHSNVKLIESLTTGNFVNFLPSGSIVSFSSSDGKQ